MTTITVAVGASAMHLQVLRQLERKLAFRRDVYFASLGKRLSAGARGYLIKDVELAEVKRAVRAVYRGHSVLDPKVAPRVIANATKRR